MMSEVFFQSPSWVFLLALLPVMLFMMWRLFCYRKKILSNFADPSQHPFLVLGVSYSQRYGRYALLIFSCLMAVLALMEPVGNAHYPPSIVEEEGKLIKAMEHKPWHEVMFLIDTSQSMAVKDTRQGMSRLDLAKEIAESVLIDLKGKMVSLTAFTSVDTPLVPATQDLLFTLLMLRQMNFNEGDVAGTDMVKALEAVNLHFKEDPLQKMKSVVLFTDGGDTGIEDKKRTEEILLALGDPFAMNLRLFVVAMGSEKGGVIPQVIYKGGEVSSALNLPLLKKIAMQGRGKVISTEGVSSESVATFIRAALDAEESPEDIQEVIRHARGAFPDPIYTVYFRWPLAFSMMALIVFLWLPQRRYVLWALCLLLSPSSVCAEDPLLYLEAGQKVRAEQMYHELLVDDKDAWHQAVERYNLGCFSLERGDYDAALGYFNAASSIKNLSPRLTSYLYLNTAIATILLAEKMVDEKEINADQGLILLRDAQDSLKKGYQEDCGVARIEGSVVCSEMETYQQVDLYLQHLVADFRKQSEVDRKNKETISLSAPQKHLQSVLDMTLSMLTLKQISQKEMDLLLQQLAITAKLFPEGMFKEPLDDAALAQKTLLDRHPAETRFFLRSLYQWLEIFIGIKEDDPKSALEAAIEKQMKAIDMVLEFNKITEINAGAAMKALLIRKQERVKEAGSTFIGKVIEQEKKEYEGHGYCQKEPWHHVLPLYFEGYKMALAAENELQKGDLVEAIREQNEVLKYWKMALKALESPPQASAATPTVRQEQAVVQTLVEMDAEDRPKKPQRSPKIIDKPW